jgi:hypothetical protein
MTSATIKGVALQSVVEDVKRLRKSGVISEADLMAAIKSDEVKLLEQAVVPGLWYPLGAYGRLLDLLCRKEGGDRSEYLIERGARAAERMMNQGAYRDFLTAANRWGERAGQAMVHLAKALYGGTRWSASYSGEAHTAEIVVDDAGEFPSSARYAAQGFVQVLFSRIEGAEVAVASHSPKPNRIVYSIRRS